MLFVRNHSITVIVVNCLRSFEVVRGSCADHLTHMRPMADTDRVRRLSQKLALSSGRPQRAPRALLHGQMLTIPTVHHKYGVLQRWLAHYGVHSSCDLPQSPAANSRAPAGHVMSHQVRRRGLGSRCARRPLLQIHSPGSDEQKSHPQHLRAVRPWLVASILLPCTMLATLRR